MQLLNSELLRQEFIWLQTTLGRTRRTADKMTSTRTNCTCTCTMQYTITQIYAYTQNKSPVKNIQKTAKTNSEAEILLCCLSNAIFEYTVAILVSF